MNKTHKYVNALQSWPAAGNGNNIYIYAQCVSQL